MGVKPRPQGPAAGEPRRLGDEVPRSPLLIRSNVPKTTCSAALKYQHVYSSENHHATRAEAGQVPDTATSGKTDSPAPVFTNSRSPERADHPLRRARRVRTRHDRHAHHRRELLSDRSERAGGGSLAGPSSHSRHSRSVQNNFAVEPAARGTPRPRGILSVTVGRIPSLPVQPPRLFNVTGYPPIGWHSLEVPALPLAPSRRLSQSTDCIMLGVSVQNPL